MLRAIMLALCCAVGLGCLANASHAEEGFGRTWGHTYRAQEWERFYHYPYVYYPQNFWGNEYYRSAESLYYRYPPEMRIPVYNKQWFNYYPESRKYYQGAHFTVDTF
ncbi:MAG: calmodulin-binding protein [Planctomycetia bacterium]|nr:calmodulin-binding protein [Planctomycetia bacterium]